MVEKITILNVEWVTEAEKHHVDVGLDKLFSGIAQTVVIEFLESTSTKPHTGAINWFSKNFGYTHNCVRVDRHKLSTDSPEILTIELFDGFDKELYNAGLAASWCKSTVGTGAVIVKDRVELIAVFDRFRDAKAGTIYMAYKSDLDDVIDHIASLNLAMISVRKPTGKPGREKDWMYAYLAVGQNNVKLLKGLLPDHINRQVSTRVLAAQLRQEEHDLSNRLKVVRAHLQALDS